MQIYADVIGHPMLIAGSAQTPALGSAIAAAVTAGEAKGGHASFERAQEKMSSLKEKRFTPDPAAARVYDELYGDVPRAARQLRRRRRARRPTCRA